jgi:hypothetical protein
VPIGTIVVVVFAWAAYTLFTPSAPPPNDGDAGTWSGPPPEVAPAAGATAGERSALLQEPNSDESGAANRQPQSQPPSAESRDTATADSESATTPEEAFRSAWRTADGKLYFGNAPPPGSVKLESFGKPAPPKSTPRPSPP